MIRRRFRPLWLRSVYRSEDDERVVFMDYTDISLPDRKILRDAFAAGLAATVAREDADAETVYAQGPLALARLVFDCGGDCHQRAVAAALAGPAVFTLSGVAAG